MITFISKYKKSMVKATAALFTLSSSLFALTSCDDFLDTLPLNDVVLENYWTQKEDVTSVLMSCYESLASSESITRMSVWGELRSDNLMQGSSVNNDMADILKENILPTNAMTKWAIMYQTINRANTVIHYAPMVQEIDPNYSPTEMKANVAEATFIRALCYFYLIRTFRDVPMSFEPSIDDLKEYQIPATPMKNALDSLINDLEKVKDNAVKRYVDDSKMTNAEAATKAYENNSRVTRLAIYALLADLNLWRGNWDKTIEYCDLVIDFKKQQYKDRILNIGDMNDMYEFAEIPLIRERVDGSTTCGNAYEEIFGTGNSFESIFELYYYQNKGTSNSYINEYYGSSSTILGRFSAPSIHCKNAAQGESDIYTKEDCRVYEYMSSASSKYAIGKYTNKSVTLDNSNVSDEKSLKLDITRRGDIYSNWIVYRLTDVMLMKAEACIMKGEAEYETAFNLIDAVNRRARHILVSGTTGLKFDDYKSSQSTMEELLFDERNRELMFEGKRWFDLVRMALRDGKTQRLVQEATIKYLDNVNAIKIKLADPNIIFFPYNREELKLNKYLKQNTAYGNTEEFVK